MELYPGEGKTDARDAFVIADAARTMPHALRRVGPDEQTVTAVGVLAGYNADLPAEPTRLTNRLHDALLHIHPALERLRGKHFRRRGVLQMLAGAGTPARLRALGEDGRRQAIAGRSPRMGARYRRRNAQSRQRPIDKKFFYVKTGFRHERRRIPRPDRAG